MKLWSDVRLSALLAAILLLQANTPGAESPRPANSPERNATAAPPNAASIAPQSLANAFWTWHPQDPLACHFRRTFSLESIPEIASILITADNGYELYINGAFVGSDIGADATIWKSVERYEIQSLLRPGENVIAIRATDLGGQSGFIAALRIQSSPRAIIDIVTDASWRVSSSTDPTGYMQAGFHEDETWQPAHFRGRFGIAPWGLLSDSGQISTGPDPANRPLQSFKSPPPDFTWPDGIVFLRGHAPQSSSKDALQAIWPIGNSRAYFELDTIGPAKLGRSLWTLMPAKPDGTARCLVDAGQGYIGSPSVSFDGNDIYFSMVPAGSKFFRIYRIPSNGGTPHVLTSGPFHDFDPEPLPGGRIAFSSTRLGSRDEYHGNIGRCLFSMNPDGTDIRPITHHIVGDNEPRVTADGNIAFVRQDNFMERAKVETHIHSVRPDGTGAQIVLGPDRDALSFDRTTAAEQDGRWLRHFGFGSPAPLPDGRIAAISSLGLVISGNQIMPPTALRPAAELIDIAPLPGGRLLCSTAAPGGIGILDLVTSELFALYTKPPFDMHSVAFLGPRPRPPVLRSTVEENSDNPAAPTGFLIGQNIFYSKQRNADLQRVTAIRVLEGRPFTLRSARHQYDHIGVEAIELGTAPLAPDGSFYVEVPADRALTLQAIDAEGRPVVNELSWIYVRPGEVRSCIGCHSRRETAPPIGATVLALRDRPVPLLGNPNSHRFRGNNGANGGVLNLQFDRFREVASIDLYSNANPTSTDAGPVGLRHSEIHHALHTLKSGNQSDKIAATQRLAIFRDRSAAPALAIALRDSDPNVRLNAALALAACGTRDSIEPLIGALTDSHSPTAQAAHAALVNLTGHSPSFNGFQPPAERAKSAGDWKQWVKANPWDELERRLIAQLGSTNLNAVDLAISALSHTGSPAAKRALRQSLSKTLSNLRSSVAIIRALGHLRDSQAVPILSKLLEQNLPKSTGKPAGDHEFGWTQAPVQLAGAAAEALGHIGSHAAEQALLNACSQLVEFWYYTFQNGDHDWLMGCNASLPHFRIAEALDAIGTSLPPPLVAMFLKSIPIDTDRALLFQTDSYENIVAHLVRRSGLREAVIEACLAVLRDSHQPSLNDALQNAVTESPPAVSVGPLCPESRAAQILSIICLDPGYAPRLRAAFQRYRELPPSRTRSWTCFYLARALGELRDAAAVPLLLAALDHDPTEASFGLVDPPNVFLHEAMTPCYRAAAAIALGRIGDRSAAPSLIAAIKNLDNAVDVRHAAASALSLLAIPDDVRELESLANSYPEIATRQVLHAAWAALKSGKTTPDEIARHRSTH